VCVCVWCVTEGGLKKVTVTVREGGRYGGVWDGK
jgi:hypothetical protein